MKPNEKKLEDKGISDGSMRKCPFCAEMVKAEAKVCKHCQSNLFEYDTQRKEKIEAGLTGNYSDMISSGKFSSLLTEHNSNHKEKDKYVIMSSDSQLEVVEGGTFNTPQHIERLEKQGFIDQDIYVRAADKEQAELAIDELVEAFGKS